MIVELVEGVKEFFLCALFAAQHVDVIHEKYIRGTIKRVKLRHAVQPDARDHFVHEPLAGRVDDPHAGVVVGQRTADGMHQVSLAHAHAGVNE